MSSVVIAGDTSGSVTLQAPATAGSPILTLPTTSGTLLTSATNNISASNITTGTLPYAQLPTGSVLQVVQVQTTNTTSTTSTSFTAVSGMTASITPKFSTSKILVIVNIAMQTVNNGTGSGGAGIAIYKNGSYLSGDTAGYVSFYTNLSSTSPRTRIPMIYLDSPATTSSTTYALYFAAWNSNQSNTNDGGQQSNITLMEIAG